MSIVSVTAVGAFDAVGSILVVALMIAPAATAYLLTDRLSGMLWISAAIGTISAIAGYWFAHYLDASIAGCMAAMLGLAFGAAFALSPQRGLLALARRRRRQRFEFAQKMLTIHLLQHEGSAAAVVENRVQHLGEHLRWSHAFSVAVVQAAQRAKLIEMGSDKLLYLTELGREHAREAVVN